jgi:hypothetical protein
MQTNYSGPTLRLCAGIVLLAVLASCSKPPKPGEPDVGPPPAESTPAAPTTTPSNGQPGSEVPAPDSAAPAPAPTPDAPPPTDSSPIPKPTAAEPNLNSMHAAVPSAKISVPVDLRYQFDGEALPNQPVTLHLAAVSRVAGSNLHVTVRQMNGLQVASAPLEVEKTAVAGVYRQQLSITRAASGPDHLRVLVTMDEAGGNGFGYFTVPFSPGNPPQKQESVKQR